MSRRRLSTWKVEAEEPMRRCNAILEVRAADEERARAAFYRAARKRTFHWGPVTEEWPIVSVERISA